MTGSVLAQALTLAAIPVLSRLYGPDDFGVFGLFTALLSIIGVAACLRYALAIPLPKTNRQAAQVLACGAVALACVSAVVLLVVIMARGMVAAALDAPKLETLLWLLPLSVLGYGVYELSNYWATRNGRFKALAASHVTRAATVTGTQMAAAAAPGGAFGLVIGQLAGQWVTNLVLAWHVLHKDRGVIASGFRWERICTQARRYRTFAFHGAPQAVLNSVSQTIPVIMLGWFFSPAIVGLYIMAQRVVSAPMILISQSLRQVLLPHFSRRRHAGHSLRPVLLRYTTVLAVLGMPALLVLLFFGDNVFSVVLGQEWEESGRYAGWLALWLWAEMLSPPATIALTVLERPRVQMIYEAILLIARIMALTTAAWTNSPEKSIIVFSVVGLFFNLGLIAIAFFQCLASEPKKST